MTEVLGLSAFLDLAPDEHAPGLELWERLTGYERSASRGDDAPPLNGVPIAIKDDTDVEGQVSAHGSLAHDFVPAADAEVVGIPVRSSITAASRPARPCSSKAPAACRCSRCRSRACSARA